MIKPQGFEYELISWFDLNSTPNLYLFYFLNLVLLFVQAIMVSRLVITHRLSRELSLVPGAIFIIFAASILEPFVFHYIFLANFFFILSLNAIFNIYKKYKPIATIYNAGFFLGVATIIYFPYCVFLVAMIMGLNNLRSINLKETLQLIFGFLAAIFLAAIAFFYFDGLEIWANSLKDIFNIPSINFANPIQYLKPAIFIITLILLMGFTNTLRKKKKYDAIRKIELTYALLFVSLFSIFLVPQISEQHLILVSLPVAVLGGLILEIKSKVYIREFVFLGFIGLYFVLLLQLI